MSEKGINGLISILRDAENVPKDVWYSLLMLDVDERKEVVSLARRITEDNFGKGVFVRALIEISSYCKNNCRYCGLRAANKDAVRYRLTKEDILECCNEAALLGFNTFVMQGGEVGRDIHVFRDLIADKQIDEAKKIMSELENKTNPRQEDLVRLRAIIKRLEILGK